MAGTNPRIRALADDLRPDETVCRIAEGAYDGDSGLLVLTTARLFFRPDGRRAAVRLDVTLPRLTAVRWSPGLDGGTVGVVTAGGTREVSQIAGADGVGLVDDVRTALAEVPAAVPQAQAAPQVPAPAPQVPAPALQVPAVTPLAGPRTAVAADSSAEATVVLPRVVGEPEQQPIAGGDADGPETVPVGESVVLSPAAAGGGSAGLPPETAVGGSSDEATQVAAKAAGTRAGRRARHTRRAMAGLAAHDTLSISGARPGRRPTRWRRVRRPLIAVAVGAVGVLGALAALSGLGAVADGAGTPTPSQVVAPVPAPRSALPPAADLPAGPTVTVDRVVDGDTVEVTGAVDGPVQVLGIDAAELGGDGCYARESALHAAGVLLGEEVALVTDPGQPATDRSGRTLAYLRLADGSDYSMQVVAAGMASYYVAGGTLAHTPELEAARNSAEAAGLGLWGPPCNGNIDDPPGSTPPRVTQAPARVAVPEGARLVRARTYCATEGEVGVLIDGAAMVCTGPDDDRRWRPAG